MRCGAGMIGPDRAGTGFVILGSSQARAWEFLIFGLRFSQLISYKIMIVQFSGIRPCGLDQKSGPGFGLM